MSHVAFQLSDLYVCSVIIQGHVNSVPVRMDRLQTMISSACIEHLDFLGSESCNLNFTALKELEIDNSSNYKSLSDLPKLMNSDEDSSSTLQDFVALNLNDLIATLHSTSSRFTKALILHELVNRYGMKLQIKESTAEELFSQLSAEAASVQNWKTVRYCTSMLHRTVDSLAPSITGILIRGKIVSLGVYGKDEIDITKPLPPDSITQILYEKIFPHNLYQAVLIQELIIMIDLLQICTLWAQALFVCDAYFLLNSMVDHVMLLHNYHI